MSNKPDIPVKSSGDTFSADELNTIVDFFENKPDAEELIPGPEGPQGIQGIQGPEGPKGVDGQSAYSIAVENGYVGTEEEWIESLSPVRYMDGDIFDGDGETPETKTTIKDGSIGEEKLSEVVQRKLNGNVRNVLDYGAVADGVANDRTALLSAINALPSSGGTVVIPKNHTIRIGSKVTLENTSNIEFTGGGSILAESRIILEFLGNQKNIKIINLGFSSDLENTIEDVFGLITFYDAIIDGLVIEKCKFTAPSCDTNGIKIISEVGVSKNIRINKNDFEDIGRMGIEFQSHVYDSVSKIKEITTNYNNFNNLGTVSQYGMAISISGSCENGVVIGNKLNDCKTAGLEAAWFTKNITFSKNTFSYQNRGYFPISISSMHETANNKNITIVGNIFDMKGAPDLSRVNLARIEGYSFVGNVGTISELSIESVRGSISANILETDVNYSIWFQNGATGNIVQGNHIINTQSSNYALIGFNNVSGNQVIGNRLNRSEGFLYQSVGSSSNNILLDNIDEDNPTIIQRGSISGSTNTPTWV